MKNLLHILFIFFSLNSFAQVNSVMPPEANKFYNNAIHSINPAIKNIVEKNAINLKGRKVNMDSLSKMLHYERILKNTGQRDIDAITILIMVQISRNADADLKNLVLSMKNSDNSKPDDNKSAEKAESILNNKSRIAENVTVVMRKISGSTEIALENLR